MHLFSGINHKPIHAINHKMGGICYRIARYVLIALGLILLAKVIVYRLGQLFGFCF